MLCFIKYVSSNVDTGKQKQTEFASLVILNAFIGIYSNSNLYTCKHGGRNIRRSPIGVLQHIKRVSVV